MLISSHRDHPRGCGEHPTDVTRGGIVQGSSPRMRGALVVMREIVLEIRIIPADAGSTYNPRACSAAPGDHPRGCGEHSCQASSLNGSGGSSPRMRGAPKGDERSGEPPGIIPADAGSTRSHPIRHRHSQDHPRGCGEHPHHAFHLRQIGGSSPRMRGALWSPCCLAGPRGIIPADAGSTVMGRPWMKVIRDHPRGCGEHTPRFCLFCGQRGSSPRMRGALKNSSSRCPMARIIPADAGSTV